MKFLPTNRGNMTAAQIVDALNYSCYAFNRSRGMTAAALGRLFPVTGAAMETRYQQERQQTEAA